MHLCLEDILTEKEIQQIRKEQDINIKKAQLSQTKPKQKPSNNMNNNASHVDNKLVLNMLNMNIHR